MTGFFIARFCLGVAESGLFPGVVFYLSMWYKREEQHYRISLFFSAASLAGAFGGVLAWVSDHRYIIWHFIISLVIIGHCSYERGRWPSWLALDIHP